MRFARLLSAILLLCGVLFFSADAAAQAVKLAIVDMERAMSEVKDGQRATASIDKLRQEKMTQIQQMETQLMAAQQEYEKNRLILSDAARQEKEQELMQGQMVYQQAYMGAEQELQMAWAQTLEGLYEKMSAVCETIGKEGGYSMVLDKSRGGVLYNGGATDLTNELIKRYDAKHGG